MRLRRASLAAATAAAISFSGLMPASAASPTVSTPQHSSAVLSAPGDLQNVLRAEWGLDPQGQRSDLSAGRGVDAGLGFPITAADAVEMSRRAMVASAMAKVDASLVVQRPSDYAGWYMDQASGGIATIMLRSASDQDNRMLAAVAGSRYKIVTPRFNSVELESALALVRGLDGQVTTAGDALVRSSGISRERNAVLVRLSNDASSSQMEAVGELHPAIASDKGEVSLVASRTDGSQRAYGGMYIKNTTRGNVCTTSTSARASDGSYYAMTAGHCGKTNQQHSLGTSNVFALGVGRLKNGFYDYGPTQTSYCDCQIVGSIPTLRASNAAIVEGGDTYPYTSFAASASEYYEQRPLCISGWKTATDTGNQLQCGKIASGGVNVRVTTYDEFDGVQHNTYVTEVILNSGEDVNRPGDSGAPVGSGSMFLGILSSVASGHSFFSRSSNIPAYTNGTPVTSEPYF